MYYTRRRFPVITAFAVTVHKSQGLSLETAIVDAGPATFGPGNDSDDICELVYTVVEI